VGISNKKIASVNEGREAVPRARPISVFDYQKGS